MILTQEPLSLEKVYQDVATTKHGAVVTFSGNVRDTENDAPIHSISYDVYEEMAGKELHALVHQIEKKWKVKVSMQHRVGKVPIGEASVVIACAGVHRKEAFEACAHLMEMIKERVPIWKVQFEE